MGLGEILYEKTFIDSWRAFSTVWDFMSLSEGKKRYRSPYSWRLEAG